MRVGIVGDSQSEGLYPTLAPLLRAKGMEVVGRSLVRGMSLASMRSNIEQQRSARDVADASEVLIVILGGNNRQSDLGRYRELVRWFLRDVAFRPRQIWWVGPAFSVHPTWRASHARTRELQRSIFRGSGKVRWVDAWPMTSEGIQFAGDQLHFTSAGYRSWARRLIHSLPPPAPVSLFLAAGLAGAAMGALLAWVRR